MKLGLFDDVLGITVASITLSKVFEISFSVFTVADILTDRHLVNYPSLSS